MSARWTRWDRALTAGPPVAPPEPALPAVPGIRIDVLGRPPSWNHAYRRGREGRVVLTDDARRWKEDIRLLTLDTVNRTGWRHSGGPIAVYVWLYLDQEMDADNGLKLTLDGLALGLRVNDRLFLPRVMGLRTGQSPERVVLYVVNEGES